MNKITNKSIKKLSLKGTFWTRMEQDDISAIKFEEARLHFFNDIFVAVAFYVA